MNGLSLAVIAYSCDPSSGSEPGAGAAFALAAATLAEQTGHTCHIYTRHKHVHKLRLALRDGRTSTVVVVPHRFVGEKLFADSSRIHASLWQVSLGMRLRRHPPTVAHHVTYASDTLPSAVHFLGPSTRRVWGPVGGTDVRTTHPTSWGWRAARLVKRSWLRALARRTDLTICQTMHVAELIGTSASTTVEQNCLVPAPPPQTQLPQNPQPRVLLIGNLSPRKRPGLALAAARAGRGMWTLHVIGEGALRATLEADYQEEIAQGTITFHGAIPREDVLTHLRRADGVIHTSIREGAPWAIAEALTYGRWVVTAFGNGADALTSSVADGGAVVHSTQPEEWSQAVLGCALAGLHPKTHRWSADRFTELLPRWYGLE